VVRPDKTVANGVQMCGCRLLPNPAILFSFPKDAGLREKWAAQVKRISGSQLNIPVCATNILKMGVLSQIASYPNQVGWERESHV
jgi:hypothetical protein